MKKLKREFKLDKVVLFVSIISLIWIIIYKVDLINRNEIFPYAIEIGEIFYGILSSIIASSIFYYFVVYLDRKRKQSIIDKIVLNKLRSIATSLLIIKKDVFPILGLKFNDEIPNLEEFIKICKGLDFRHVAPHIPNTSELPIIWYDYFNTFFNSDTYHSQMLYKHIMYLDIELVELLDEIQYPIFKHALISFRINEYTHDISGAPGPFWSYLKSLEAILEYSKKLKK